jgi:hypothetical protein
MGIDAEVFSNWKHRLPAFLTHIVTDVGDGSGVQVNPRHVVTCAHVFGREHENFYASGGPLANVIHRQALIRSGNFEAGGIVVAQHASLDLALVRLEKARLGVAPPPLFEESYLGMALAVGVRRNAARLEAMHHEFEVRIGQSWLGDTPSLVKFPFGPREGSSGGGVFTIREGRLLLIGIVQLGGEAAGIGGFIPSKAVLDFLKQELDFKNPTTPDGSYRAILAAQGILPELKLAASQSELELNFVAIKSTKPGARVSFVSRQVVAANEMKLQTPDRILPGHRRLAAWAGRITEADAAIEHLSGAFDMRLRLPTPDELAYSWGVLAQAVKAPQGRPLKLTDFGANELQIQVPPVGVYEWARDRNGKGYAMESGVNPGGMACIDESRVEVIEPCFRVAFDAEGL